MSVLIGDQSTTTRLSAGKVSSCLNVKTVWSVQCEVNVYWLGGNVTDLTDSLLLQAARLWQTCTRPNTPCVFESSAHCWLYQSWDDAGWTGKRKDTQRIRSNIWVCLCELGAIRWFTWAATPTSFSDEGIGGVSKQYKMRLNVLSAAVTTETIS